jgi:SAM-dependent methyltransferase
MAYADITLRDPNPVKRWLHRQRFRDAVDIARRENVPAQGERPLRILDFGAGDGELICQLLSLRPIEGYVYEPTPSLMAEATSKLAGAPGITFITDITTAPGDYFDLVYCLEVFEHLPVKETDDALREIARLLTSTGRAIIGVPHELYLPALIKGVFRMTRRYGSFDATPRWIAAAMLGRPPANRPVREIAPGFPYHHAHMGFDFRALARRLEERFTVVEQWFSPARPLGRLLNSEVYFVVRKR